jgi:hypothetical protein
MRNLLLAGTAGLFLTLGAAAAYAVPQNSPYATMVSPDAVDGYSTDNYPNYGNSGMIEGRSAYVDPQYGYDNPGYVDPGYGEYASPAPVGGLFVGGGGRGGHFGGGHFGFAPRHGR